MSTREPVNVTLLYTRGASYEFNFTYTRDTSVNQNFVGSEFLLLVEFMDGVEEVPLTVVPNGTHEVTLSHLFPPKETRRLWRTWSSYEVLEVKPEYTHKWQQGRFDHISLDD